MNRIFRFTIIGCLFITLGCSKVKPTPDASFDINLSNTMYIPSPPPYIFGDAVPAHGLIYYLPVYYGLIDHNQFLQDHNTTAGKLKSVSVNSINLQISGDQTPDFNFTDTVRVYAYSDSLTQLLIGHRYGIDSFKNDLFLTPDDVDFKQCFLSDTVKFKVYMHLRAIPSSSEQLIINASFKAAAEQLN